MERFIQGDYSHGKVHSGGKSSFLGEMLLDELDFVTIANEFV